MASKKNTGKQKSGSREKKKSTRAESAAEKAVVASKPATSKPVKKPSAVEETKFSIAPGPTPEFANGKELAKAIAEKCDLVAVGSKLLSEDESKGASVRARMFETTVEYLYGKPASAPPPEAPQVRVIFDIPRPARERIPD